MTSFETSFETAEPVRLVVETGGGRVTVRATDTTTSTVELRALNDAGVEAVEQAEVTFEGGELLVDVPRRQGLLRRGASVAVDVTLPTGSDLDVKAESSDIVADGTFAVASCSTGSGDVTLDTVEGDAQVKSGSGDLRLGRAGARINASTGSGDVQVDQTGEQTQISTGSGDLSIGQVNGEVVTKTGSGDLEVGMLTGDLKSKTGSGDVVVRRAVSGRLNANGATGDVSIGVEQGTAAWLDVASVTGHVRQELGDSEGPGESQHQVEITANTVSGDVRIHRS